MARILCQQLTKRYGTVTAVDRLDLEIKDREFMVLLGPSGCGKTTTLNMIAGLEEPSDGNVFFDDEVVNFMPPHRREVAMVFQSYALYPQKTVYENIAFGLRLRRTPATEIDRLVKDAAGQLEIGHLLDRRPSQLSGGQRQRVALGRALVRKPRVFLMDEPLSNLDAALRVTMRTLIKKLHLTMGTTFVYVTHDQAEAMALGDRIVVMSHGRIAQIGTPRQVYFRPADRFVADFIGTVNCIPSSVEDRCLTFPGGCIPAADVPNVDISAGKGLRLFFRPEHATVVEKGTGHFTARVIAASFTGDRTRLLVEADTPDPLKVEAPGRQSFRKGDTVDVRLETDALFTLDNG
jgi:multiple sugar transport system ATP-binding protein